MADTEMHEEIYSMDRRRRRDFGKDERGWLFKGWISAAILMAIQVRHSTKLKSDVDRKRKHRWE
jgi:hypothetical protein